jgi:hypothetical protein
MDAIRFDPSDLADCERAAEYLWSAIAADHGDVTADRIFSCYALSKSAVKMSKNIDLLIMYLESQLPPPEFARKLAATNKRLPVEERVGPSGSTNPTTIVRQINRQITKMNKDHQLRVSVMERAGSHPNLPGRDKSKS